MKFELSEEQVKKAREWCNSQKGETGDATGFRFMLCFIPSGLGDTVKVVDLQTKLECDLSEDI